MTVLVAVLLAGGVYLVVTGGSHPSLADDLGQYLMPSTDADAQPLELVRAGAKPWLPWVLTGGLVGILLAQGDLFLAGPGRSVPALALLGGASGYFLWSVRRTNAEERRARRLRFELPIVADAIALHVVAGSSVAAAIRTITVQMDGVAIEELEAVIEEHDTGSGFESCLVSVGLATAHKDARRLYDLLAHAHESGGRLAVMLGELATDLRAGIERDLSAEGGKRAITTYGPVLALMVPTALLFLLYPTLLGLRALSGTQ
ncbi:MAG: type II secretion system F family protein [Acidimicrobiia bacterium]